MRIIVALVFCILSTPTLAQSPSTQPNQQSQQQQVTPDKRGTQQEPFIVKQIPRIYSDEERNETREKSENDRKLVSETADLVKYTKKLYGATIAVASVTGLLWIFTALMWLSTRKAVKDGAHAIKAATKAADAADLHAQTAIGVEFPRLVLTEVDMPKLRDDRKRVLHSGPLHISFVNHGRTDATIINEGYDWVVADTMAEANRSISHTRAADLGTVVPHGESYQMQVCLIGLARFIEGTLERISDEDIERILKGPKFLWVYGFVRYYDFLDGINSVGFCTRLEITRAPDMPHMILRLRFVHGGPPAYSLRHRTPQYRGPEDAQGGKAASPGGSFSGLIL